MELRASLMSRDRHDELLAVMDVQEDTAQPLGERFKRKVTGTIRMRGPIWDDFIGFWSLVAASAHEEDGKNYFDVKSLQVDHDLYAFFSWVSLEGPLISLMLWESFTGTVGEYYEEVRERNRSMQELLDRWNRPGLTRNDLREFSGLQRRDEPHLDEPLEPEVLAELRDAHLGRDGELRRCHNVIV